MSDRYELATEGIHQAELATVSETTVRIKGEEVDGVLFTWLMLDQRDSRNKPLKLFDRYPLKSQRLKQRKFDVLLFWSLDRLSREGALETLQYLQRLSSYGVAWRSFTEPYFDSCGIFKDAIIAIIATLAKQERIRISERTRAGLARVKASGRALGRPRKLNGEYRAQVAALKAQGVPGREIARRLGISEGSVRRLSA